MCLEKLCAVDGSRICPIIGIFFAASPSALARLPTRVDLSGKCPPVYDQGQIGSGTANAIGGTIHFDQMKEKLRHSFLSSRLFIYCNERVMEKTRREDAGAMIRDGIKSVAKQGVCPEKMWPHHWSSFPPNPRLKKKPFPASGRSRWQGERSGIVRPLKA